MLLRASVAVKVAVASAGAGLVPATIAIGFGARKRNKFRPLFVSPLVVVVVFN